MVQAENSPTDPFWQKIEEGFETRVIQLNGAAYEALSKLRVLRIDLEKFQVRILDSRNFGTDRMEVKDFVKRAHALAAVNGGFFLPNYQPLGLLIVDGQEVNPLRKADWGIFMIQDNIPRIIHTSQFQKEKNISQALQVGPRLVVDGKGKTMKKQIARRTALGITYKKQIILVNTEKTDAYTQDLARIFSLPESQGGLECRDALSLDGGPSAQMYVEYGFFKIDNPGGLPVPNAIGVFKK